MEYEDEGEYELYKAEEEAKEMIVGLLIDQYNFMSIFAFKVNGEYHKLVNDKTIRNVNICGYNFFPNKEKLVTIKEGRKIWEALEGNGWESKE